MNTGLVYDPDAKTFMLDDTRWNELIKANPKLQEFRYKPLQFEKELDNLFIGNSATGENAWAPTGNGPMPSEGPTPDEDARYTHSEYMEPYNPNLLSDATDGIEDYRSRGRARGHNEIFNHAHSSLRNIIERCFGVLKARFPILKGMASYLLQTQVFIVVAAVTLHDYIRREAHREWLFEKYGNDEMIVIDSDDEDEEDDTLAEFISSTSEMHLFRNSLTSLMQKALE